MAAKKQRTVREPEVLVRALESSHVAKSNKRPKGPSVREMIDAGLEAFWELAERWELSAAEQNALLHISDSTRLRWRRAHPADDETLLDRLQLILLTYQRLNEMAGTEAEAAALLRREGSAMSSDAPRLTLLEALAAPSILKMQRHYLRLESEISAS